MPTDLQQALEAERALRRELVAVLTEFMAAHDSEDAPRYINALISANLVLSKAREMGE